MRKVVSSLCLLVLAGSIAGNSNAATPSGDFALLIDYGISSRAPLPEKVYSALKMELDKDGYRGDLRFVDNRDGKTKSDEPLVKLTITESRWETRRKMSIPYLLNRYKKTYILSVLVQVYRGADLASSDMVSAEVSSGTQAQFISNDKYDPDLLLDQSERVNLEEKTCEKLAKKLTGCLSKNLN